MESKESSRLPLQDGQPPSQTQLDAESLRLPAGWRVHWSSKRNRRFYNRAPTATENELTQWIAPVDQSQSTKLHTTQQHNQQQPQAKPAPAISRTARRYAELVDIARRATKQDSKEVAVAPVVSVYLEETPELVCLRKNLFDDLDKQLSELCKDAGLKSGQPSMAFLRWGFCQRMLQASDGGICAMSQDPLLPVEPVVDSGLLNELLRERLSDKSALDVCYKIAKATKASAKMLVELRQKLHEQHLAEWKSAHTNSWGFTKTYPAGSIAGALRYDPIPHVLGSVTYHKDNKQLVNVTVNVSCDGWTLPLSVERLEKLWALYERHTEPIAADDAARARFLRRVWTMLARYDTIGGAGYQAALPECAFEVLRSEFGVTHECFASPLNQYMDSYNSAFPDTDRFFGSQGSFLDMDVTEGGFEGNPPFLEEVMAAQALHVVHLLDKAEYKNKSLCFVIIWPGWKDTPGYSSLIESKFCRKLIEFDKYKHVYKQGFQHQVSSIPASASASAGTSAAAGASAGTSTGAGAGGGPAMYRVSGAKSNVFFLQTSAAAKKWPVSSRTVDKFIRVFGSG